MSALVGLLGRPSERRSSLCDTSFAYDVACHVLLLAAIWHEGFLFLYQIEAFLHEITTANRRVLFLARSSDCAVQPRLRVVGFFATRPLINPFATPTEVVLLIV